MADQCAQRMLSQASLPHYPSHGPLLNMMLEADARRRPPYTTAHCTSCRLQKRILHSSARAQLPCSVNLCRQFFSTSLVQGPSRAPLITTMMEADASRRPQSSTADHSTHRPPHSMANQCDWGMPPQASLPHNLLCVPLLNMMLEAGASHQPPY